MSSDKVVGAVAFVVVFLAVVGAVVALIAWGIMTGWNGSAGSMGAPRMGYTEALYSTLLAASVTSLGGAGAISAKK